MPDAAQTSKVYFAGKIGILSKNGRYKKTEAETELAAGRRALPGTRETGKVLREKSEEKR